MNSAAASTFNTGNSAIKRILIIKLRHYGDLLLTTPVIETLHRHYPNAEIDVLIYQETAAVLQHHPLVSSIFVIDREWKNLGFQHAFPHEWRLMRALRARDYELVLNFADQWRSAFITRLTGARRRLGFDFPKRRSRFWRWTHSHLVSVEGHECLHVVEQNLALLKPLKIAPLSTKVNMHYSTQDWIHSQQLLVGEGINAQYNPMKYILVQPTARWVFKCWSEKKMGAMLTMLLEEGHNVVITAGPNKEERRMVNNIIAHSLSFDSSPSPHVKGKIISLAGQLTLCNLAALIDHAQLFIGVDSVSTHMAAALSPPCVALFGASKVAYWRPWQSAGEIIWAGDYGALPDPDEIDTSTQKRYLDLIPVEAVVCAARRYLS